MVFKFSKVLKPALGQDQPKNSAQSSFYPFFISFFFSSIFSCLISFSGRAQHPIAPLPFSSWAAGPTSPWRTPLPQLTNMWILHAFFYLPPLPFFLQGQAQFATMATPRPSPSPSLCAINGALKPSRNRHLHSSLHHLPLISSSLVTTPLIPPLSSSAIECSLPFLPLDL